MKNMMEYRDYYGSVEYSDEDETFYGKVAFLRELISYEGQTVKRLKQAFRQAVDDYLKFCNEEGKKPEQPFKGTFNVRTGPELHRKASVYAESHNTNLNQVVKEALENFLHAPFRLGSGRGDPLVNKEVAAAANDIEWWRMTKEEIAEWTDGPIMPPDEPTAISSKRAAKSKGKS